MKKFLMMMNVCLMIGLNSIDLKAAYKEQVLPHNKVVEQTVAAGKFTIPNNPIVSDPARQAAAKNQSAQDHNTAAVTVMNRALKLNNPEDGGLTLSKVKKSTILMVDANGDDLLSQKPIQMQTKAQSKVEVTVGSAGKITHTTITHPTSWLGLSKPVTTIEHGEDGAHTVTTTDTGLLGWFSKPTTKTIVHNPVDRSIVELNDNSFASDGFVSHHTLDKNGDVVQSNLFTTDNKFIATVAPNASGPKTMVSIANNDNRVISTGEHNTEYTSGGQLVRDENNLNTTVVEQGA